MKQFWAILGSVLLATAASLPSGALAAEITFVSVVGSWRDPVDNVPGVQAGDPVITNGDPISSISWGTTDGDQSGYDFIASLPPPFDLPGAIPFFSLGTFQHRNFEVGDPSLTSVLLDVELVLAVDGVPTGPLTFTFTLNHEETPNNLDPCPYPTPPGDGCTDRVTITASAEPTTFNVGGVDYTLEMSFLDNGSPVDEFITAEGDIVNSTGLVGEFTLPPGLTVTKTGPATMRIAQWGDFAIGVQNESEADAYDVTLIDRLPDGPTGGMCDTTPEILSAQVFESDGVTPVAGKGPLVQGADYSFAWDGAACSFTVVTQTAAAVIGIGERLMIEYRTRLDEDSEDGVTLTNVAGATEWFNADRSTQYLRNLTDGTVGVGDHEDAHSVIVDLPELRFEKTVMNVTTGEDPGTVATPGDTLRYTLYVENLGDSAFNGFSIVDDIDALNADPAFRAGTLNVVSLPAGADAGNTDANGGSAGTGLLDVRGLNLPGLGDSVTIEFEVALAPVLTDGSYVSNQSEILDNAYVVALSDDPNVNGQADPAVAGDEDPTRILIESAPYFVVEKISTYLEGDPDVLLAGEALRYTITVANTGTDDAYDARIVDQIPANTTYVAGSTTLNGVAVADAADGASPLSDGITINAPGADPGSVPASPAPGADETAVIEFDVRVDPDAADGLVISNQAFVSAPDSEIFDRPSDDPRTEEPDDPTRDIVGRLPLLFAAKSAELQDDLNSPGIVDPGDTLRYTIAIYNNGAVPATLVELTDSVPANTTYVADSTWLNGQPVGRPDGGVFPLEAGLPVSSADLTPPLPGIGEGVLNPGESAIVQFDLLVDADTAPGTLITNQAVVESYERPDLLTDGDGDPATGPEPTVVVVGDQQQLAITKQVAVVGGGAAEAGSTLEYLVTVTNIASVPAYDVVIYDDLDVPDAGHLVYVDGSATMNGSADDVVFAGTLLTADYSAGSGALQPDETVELRFRAMIEPTLPIGTTVTNVAEVRWNGATQNATASVSIDVGGVVGSGALNGTVWHDEDFDDTDDVGERLLEGWTVELYRDDVRVRTTLTDSGGNYRISGLVPNYLTDEVYELRFLAPGAGPRTAALGLADSEYLNYPQRISGIVVSSGDNQQDLNLPIDPNGVIYNSLSRAPVAGAVVTLLEGGAPVPSACFDDPVQQDQVTVGDGYYKFDLNFTEPGCPGGASYTIRVTPPSSDYVAGTSELIPPAGDPAAGPFDVPSCPGSADDAVPATAGHCEVQTSAFAPPAAAPARSPETAWYEFLRLDDTAVPGSSQLFNNHIPIDPELSGSVTVTKTTPMVNVTRGQLVPYLITVGNSIEIPLPDVNVVDRLPAGFVYVAGSARLDDAAAEPIVNGRELIWPDLTLAASGRHEIRLLLAVGAGVSEGEFVNRAQAMSGITGGALSGEATATVRLVPDPDFDCTDVTGKVFDDRNRDGVQDVEEMGLAGVRLVTARGLAATTDAHGRFHITCAITPNETRGSNFVLKLDDRTLPSGFRPSTRVLQIKRATRGKALRFSFGASIHRVVGLDIADDVFEPGSTELKALWEPRLGLLLDELRKGPAVLRLSYLADVEDPRLVERRVRAMKRRIMDSWEALECCYALAVEPEIFWRLGEPPDQPRSGGETADD